MSMQFGLAYFCLEYIFPALKPNRYPTRQDYLTGLVPCGVATAMDIGLSNLSLKVNAFNKSITLSFYTMVKSAAPVFVLIFAFLFRLEKVNWKLILVIFVICLGVAIMVANETKFNWTGYLQIQAATIISGLRWVLTQVLLENQRSGMNNPLATSLFLAPVVAISLFFAFIFAEGFPSLAASPKFDTITDTLVLLFSLGGGGILAFVMVNIEYALICSTGVVTLSVAGIMKEIVTITAAIIVFGDKMTTNLAAGLVISLIGIAGVPY
jgi:solute carrier family 35, member C2